MAELASSESDINSRPGVFRFLDLAAEIRNEVYSLLVVAEAQVYNLAIFSTPAIAGVSSQLRSESLPMIFAEAEFFMNVFADLHEQASRRPDAEPQLYRKGRPSEESGRLYLEKHVLQMLREAGYNALFRNFSFRMFCRSRSWVMEPSFRDDKTPPEACVSLISISANKDGSETEVVSWASHPDLFKPPRRERGGWIGRAPQRWTAMDVKTTTDRVEIGVQKVAAREGFSGLFLHDLEAIAICFRPV